MSRSTTSLVHQSLGVRLAIWTASLGEEALPFQVLLAHRAAETLGVIRISQCLDPPITRVDGELTRNAFGGEQCIPVILAERLSILHVEGRISDGPMTVGAQETLGVPLTSQCGQAVPDHGSRALGARRGQVLLVTELAVGQAVLFHETNVQQFPMAILSGAHKMIWAPGLVQC
jgi:hypothetical protein